MAKLEVGHNVSDGGPMLWFWCPGCQMYHMFDKRWQWNGDIDRPTFTPSLLCDEHGDRRCHSFVTDGKINYLSDCHHALAGQSVEMEDA